MSGASPTYIDTALWGKLRMSTLGAEPTDSVMPMFIGQDRFRIGRNTSCNMPIPLSTVETLHLTIYRAGDIIHASSYWVENHTAGTVVVDGLELPQNYMTEIDHGSRITLAGPTEEVITLEFTPIPTQSFKSAYKLGTYIGMGGYGSVYEAKHNSTGSMFAVKVIRKIGLGSPKREEDEHVLKEILLLQQLRHPKIVNLQSIHETRQNFYIVMELMPYGDLLQHTVAENGLTETKAKRVMVDLCEAPRFLHKHGVLHRDLKPENVLVANVKPIQVKLADFGLAKYVEKGTFAKTALGTPVYMAPEIYICKARGGQYDQKIDQWCLGVTLYMMFAPTDPFDPDDVKWNHKLKMYDDLRSPKWENVTHISSQARQLIRLLLQKNPANRPSIDQKFQPFVSSTRRKQLRNTMSGLSGAGVTVMPHESFDHTSKANTNRKNSQRFSTKSENSYIEDLFTAGPHSPPRNTSWRPLLQQVTVSMLLILFASVVSRLVRCAHDSDLTSCLPSHIIDLVPSVPVMSGELDRRLSALESAVIELQHILPHQQGSVALTSTATEIQRAIQHHCHGHVGLPNFALRSAGAQVVSSLTTPTRPTRRWWSVLLKSPRLSAHPPESVLVFNNDLGTCWNVGAPSGQLGILLTEPIIVSHVTVEHISPQIAHDIKLAPREVLVWGLVNDEEVTQAVEEITLPDRLKELLLSRPTPPISAANSFIPLGLVEYNITADVSIQTFTVLDEVRALGIAVDVVVVDVVTNWGSPTTCLYGVQIHGTRLNM
ncbi:kinase-like protein [Coniophora puteana RWD-64-598 SS2]|uniref:Kinase-like protein n=1 Tax=Coniophora puteana (strain RWD-64-598) TaxID=741705 RepID=A0A5M3N4L1_CONPW|nr:kinase-like protein [Coniophora puteana RWD-64-598 SS2]EIW85775.1 kinase-like protein [Coniophora puteana RWD-64-598 SS2]